MLDVPTVAGAVKLMTLAVPGAPNPAMVKVPRMTVPVMLMALQATPSILALIACVVAVGGTVVVVVAEPGLVELPQPPAANSSVSEPANRTIGKTRGTRRRITSPLPT